jgi:ATP-dependent Zn protease
MVKDWGMSEKVGLRTQDGNNTGFVVVNELSPGTNDQIDSEIKRILTVSFAYLPSKVVLDLHSRCAQLESGVGFQLS